MIAPKIHDNGTPVAAMMERYNAAHDALDAAYIRLKSTAPNPRDYDNYEAATAEHMARLRKLDEVMDELESLMNVVEKAGKP